MNHLRIVRSGGESGREGPVDPERARRVEGPPRSRAGPRCGAASPRRSAGLDADDRERLVDVHGDGRSVRLRSCGPRTSRDRRRRSRRGRRCRRGPSPRRRPSPWRPYRLRAGVSSLRWPPHGVASRRPGPLRCGRGWVAATPDAATIPTPSRRSLRSRCRSSRRRVPRRSPRRRSPSRRASCWSCCPSRSTPFVDYRPLRASFDCRNRGWERPVRLRRRSCERGDRRTGRMSPYDRLVEGSGGTTAEVRWIGHSTVLISLDGVRLLTDPLLRVLVAHLRRRVPIDREALRGVDAVLISHAHHDHLDIGVAPAARPEDAARRAARARLAPPPAGLPRRPRARRRARGSQIGARAGRGDVRRARRVAAALPRARRAVGYAVLGSRRIYFAGDTDLFPEMDGLVPDLDLALDPDLGLGAEPRPGRAPRPRGRRRGGRAPAPGGSPSRSTGGRTPRCTWGSAPCQRTSPSRRPRSAPRRRGGRPTSRCASSRPARRSSL